MVRRALGALAVIGALSASAAAETLLVPLDHATIQAAVDAAQAGDVVVVAPGTYHENVVFRGRDITLRARNGAAVTVIDGGGVGPVVTFESGETQDCVLEGFTLRGGVGSPADGRPSVGGGIQIVGAWPVIRGCTIRQCTAERGGGVYAGGTAEDATKLLSCVIEDNSADVGGGIAQDGVRVEVFDALVRRNTAASQGGGFHARPLGGSAAAFLESVFEHNVSGGGGGAGTIEVEADGNYVVGENLFRENVAAGPGGALNIISHATGGGLVTHGNVGACEFHANRASRGGAYALTGTGSGAHGLHTLHRNLFARNVADGHDLGGALWVSQVEVRVSITVCTFVDNVAPAGGGALYAQGPDDSGSSIFGSLAWGNGPAPFAGDLAAAWSYTTSNLQHGAPVGASTNAIEELPPRFQDPPVFDYSVPEGHPSELYGSEMSDDDPWSVIRSALPGREGYPSIAGAGDMLPGSIVWILSGDLPPGSPGLGFVGLEAQWRPILGGSLVPTEDVVFPFVVSHLGGGPGILGTLPDDTPPGLEFYVQVWAVDALATKGWVATDTIKFRTR